MAYDICPQDGLSPGAALVPLNKYLDMSQFSAELKAALGDPNASVPLVVTVEGGYTSEHDFEAVPGVLYLGPIDSPWPVDPAVVDGVISAHVVQRHWGFTDEQKYLHDIQVKTSNSLDLTDDEQADQIKALMAYASGSLPQCECTTPLNN
jgi:hypothetical protein